MDDLVVHCVFLAVSDRYRVLKNKTKEQNSGRLISSEYQSKKVATVQSTACNQVQNGGYCTEHGLQLGPKRWLLYRARLAIRSKKVAAVQSTACNQVQKGGYSTEHGLQSGPKRWLLYRARLAIRSKKVAAVQSTACNQVQKGGYCTEHGLQSGPKR